MKSLIQAVVVAVALATPLASFADSTITRAQVRAELVQLQNNGYHVGDGDNAHYPAAIQAAEARVAAQDRAASGYGGVANGSSQSGANERPLSEADWHAMYDR
jgi:Domain of unknown function (DUF4148)